MAEQLPLNVFRTRAYELTTVEQTIYSTPSGYTGIVLGAQVSNIGAQETTITFILRKNDVDYVMLNEFIIPANDAAEATTGKLVVEQGSSIKARAGSNNTLNLVLSILETTNE
jgi:hypothetical protein